MKNLAGRIDCDIDILEELYLAGVEIVEHDVPLRQEVPAQLTGSNGQFEFTRCWYYWVVRGPVPLEVANDMYRHPRGARDIRVAGHCGCPPPDKWARDEHVWSYHIDSQSGLNHFCDTLRQYGLMGHPITNIELLRTKVRERVRIRQGEK